jgi:hypothetical protein
MKKKLNITIERDLWDGLNAFAHEQSLLQGTRFSSIEALRTAIKVFLRLEIKEINQILDRDTRSIG